jgi:D-lactate dehydrogenase
MESLCCGTPFESKGFFEQADKKCAELEQALFGLTKNRTIPILSDMSTCTYRMRRKFDPASKVYEPIEFIATFLMDKLNFTKQTETIALHISCPSLKMGQSEKFKTVAEACAQTVIIPAKVGCCGFAGDRGFNFPELNESALADLKASLSPETTAGYSNNRTCEIGLSYHGGIDYQSLIYLVDRCTSRKG